MAKLVRRALRALNRRRYIRQRLEQIRQESCVSDSGAFTVKT
ncbi:MULTISPECIES: hypothetical protein [Sphingobium]|nr:MULTISPECIES: hypothetical protein [Sphingobium]